MVAESKEADARIMIDDQLRAAGWNPADKSRVLTEVKVSNGHVVAEPGVQQTVLHTADGDAIPTGRADYVLLDQRGRPLAIIEAKKQAIQPYTAKQQALPYAKQIGAPFIFLTNGELIYFWDYQNDAHCGEPTGAMARGLDALASLRERMELELAWRPVAGHA